MKSLLPFFALLVVFASCTTAYKSGQTPDDVYFSPARPQQNNEEYVRTDNQPSQYNYDEQYDDDRYLRMKVHNRRVWSDLDYYYNDPFAYNYNYLNRFNSYGSLYYNTPWNYYSSWNYFYNPYSNYYNNYYNPYYTPYGYGSKVVIVNPRTPVYNSPRRFNLNVYNTPLGNNAYNNNNSRRVYRGDNRNFNYNNRYSNNNNYSNNNAGNGLRNIFNNNNSSNNNSSFNSSNRPSNNSSSSSSSSPSRSSSNAPVRKF